MLLFKPIIQVGINSRNQWSAGAQLSLIIIEDKLTRVG